MTLPPEAFACLPLERATLPRTVWHIAVAALLANSLGPTWETESSPRVTVDPERGEMTIHGEQETRPKRGGRVAFSGRWSGPMGRSPPGWCKHCGRDTMPGGERGCDVCSRCSAQVSPSALAEVARRAFAPGPVPDFVTVDGVTYDMREAP